MSLKKTTLKKIISLFALVSLGIAGCKNDPMEVEDGNDKSFIDGLVPHHEMALMMADDALAKASRESLKMMAEKMKVDQSAEIAELKKIRKDLLGSDSTPSGMPMQSMPAGDMYDMMWMHMMIDHHQGAIDLSHLAMEAGISGKLKTIAEKAAHAQKMEQAMIQDSLKVWFGKEHRIGDGHHM